MKLSIIICFFIIIILINIFNNNIPIKIPYSYKQNHNPSQDNKINKIKLLVWNIHKENFQTNFDKNFNFIIKNKQPNFILLQEFLYDKIYKTSFNFVFAPNIYKSNEKSFSGIINISKVPFVKTRTFLSQNLEPILKTPKISLSTEYKINNTYLLLINIHALNFQINNISFKKQLEPLFKILTLHKGPKIIAGDFNTWNKKRLIYLIKSLHKLGMRQVDFKYKKKYITTVFKNRIDHIFYDPKFLNITDFDIIKNIDSSDHTPLYVEFKIKQGNK